MNRRNANRRLWSPRIHGVFVFLAISTLMLASCSNRPTESGSTQPEQRPQVARFVTRIPWIGKGVWLKADTHMHTKFSDGRRSVEEVAAEAEHFGCDVIAITDHGDSKLKAASDEQRDAVLEARQKHPDLIILVGIEWNMPPWGGDEHVTVIVPKDDKEWTVLKEFKARFDDWHRDKHDAILGDQGMQWLADQYKQDARPILMNNHPSRKRFKSMELVADMQHWRTVNDLFVGFSGAPGHQPAKRMGAYKMNDLVDRWDPAAAVVGDAWDTLLADGLDVWAARAPSDFHNYDPDRPADYWPGQFSETWLYAAARSPDAVLNTLRAGSFFADHGHIVRKVQLLVDAQGLDRPATPGETIQVPTGQTVTASLAMKVPAKDWENNDNKIDQLELIAVVPGQEAKIVEARAPEADGPTVFKPLEVPQTGLILRARGRHANPDGPDLMFYTNPVRIKTG